jgi:serine/threonine protein kinase
MHLLLRCVAEAVCAKGIKALAKMVPFGEVLYEVSVDTWERFWKECQEESAQAELRASVEETARASFAEIQRHAAEVVHEVAADQAAEVRHALREYLAQLPGTIRRSLRRPADLSGTTIPPTLKLNKPEQLLPFLPTRIPRFQPGDRPVGNWQLVELLGVGGFGEVWKAVHPQLADLPPVALKFCTDATAAQFLRHEAKLLAQVMQQSDQEGIVALRQAYLEADPICLEYEYVNGGDLSGLLQQRHDTPPAQWMSLTNQTIARLAGIVGYAHRLSPAIVHRDLKPANILVRRHARGGTEVLVGDFGIGGVAAERALQQVQRGTTSKGDLLASALRGSHTPLYASPQQIQGEVPDPRDDVHALGVIWFQMLTGDLHAGAPTGIDWADDLQSAGQPDGLVRLLGACVAQKAAKRPADAAELAERLADLLANDALEVLPVDVLPAPPTQRGQAAQTRKPEPPALEVLPAEPAPRAATARRPSAPPTVVRAVAEETQKQLPPATKPAPLSVPPASKAAPPPAAAPSQTNNLVRSFPAADLDLGELTRSMTSWFSGENFAWQQLFTEDGATLLQIEKQGGWRKFIGMSTALNVVLRQAEGQLVVEIGAGRWIDKAAVGAVSLFILWPLAVTAAIGAWEQMQFPQRIFQRIEQFLQQGRTTGAAPQAAGSEEIYARLEKLAELKERGIITAEEFQAQKGKLLQ